MSQWKGYGPDNVLADASTLDSGPQTAANTGALTYEPYYGLRAKPFSLSSDPRSLYKSPVHSAVLEDLLSAIRRREGIVVLTGEMGTGKTTLCRAALYQLDRKTFTTFVPDPCLSREDLLRMLLVDFGEVSVDDLRRGRLTGASRPDLSYQLFEFLTSLESVDAFAVLVIDEAQHLAQPLLEEIRALSEMEAGRRLLQIVLVGQPELQTRLNQFQLRHVTQHVTMRCELRPLTKEDVAGYVVHRLATVGGSKDRIAFASAAIDLIHAASNGVPRLVNIICDRAMSRAHVDRLSVIGSPVIAGVIDELQLIASQVVMSGQVVDQVPVRPVALAPEPPPAPVAVAVPLPEAPVNGPVPIEVPAVAPIAPPARIAAPAPIATPSPVATPTPNPAGLFDRRRAPEAPATSSELHALLDLPTTAPRREFEAAPDHVQVGASAAPVWKWRVDSEVRRDARSSWVKTAGLAALGMSVVLLAGAIAFSAQGVRATAPASASAGTTAVQTPAQPAPAAPQAAIAPARAAAAVPVRPAAAAADITDTWVVQVGAFSSHDRSQSMVEELTEAGFPAFEVPTEARGGGLLYFVRVGPFKTASDADEARAKLRQFAELENAFVRSVTSVP